jgi:hypothetical protein
MKQILCLDCRIWFDAKQSACDCGWVRPGFNKWLRTAALDGHLWDQARRADKERKLESQLRG